MRVLCRGLSLVRVASHSEYGKHSILHGDCSGNPNHLTRSVSPTHIADGWSPSGDSLCYKAIQYYGCSHHPPNGKYQECHEHRERSPSSDRGRMGEHLDAPGTHRVCHALRGRNLSFDRHYSRRNSLYMPFADIG